MQALPVRPTSASLQDGFLRALAGGGGLRLFNVFFGLAVAAVMARAMGPADYGIYALALSAVSLLAIPSQLGLPTLVVREAARATARGDWAWLRGLMIRATQFAGVVALLSAAAVALLVEGGWPAFDPRLGAALAAGALFIPIVSLGALRSAALRGLGHVVQGQVPDLLVRPGAFLLLITGAIAAGAALTPALAMGLHVAAAAAGFIIGLYLLARATPKALITVAPAYDTRRWIRSLGPLSIVVGAQLLAAQAGVIVVGWFGTAAEAGLYRAAVQASSSVMLPIAVVAMIAEPLIARALAEDARAEAQRVVRLASRAVLALVAPIALIALAWNDELMSLLFGQAFMGAGPLFAILCLGPFVAALIGSPEALLYMSHNEGVAARLLTYGVLANLVLTVALTLAFGMIGAASATVIAAAVTTAAMARSAYRRIGISVSPFGREP